MKASILSSLAILPLANQVVMHFMKEQALCRTHMIGLFLIKINDSAMNVMKIVLHVHGSQTQTVRAAISLMMESIC